MRLVNFVTSSKRAAYLAPVLAVAGAACAFAKPVNDKQQIRAKPVARALLDESCVQALLTEKGAKRVPSAGQMLRRHSILGRLVAQDHWFDMMESEQMVQDMVCVYNSSTMEFHTVVRVGRDVCGYPRTVHGGLTAAVADETFGGLYVSLWAAGKLGARPPGMTAKLEVDYLKTLAADTVIVCSTEVLSIQGRKTWMQAHVYDGRSGIKCATAKALFVSPRWTSVARTLVPFGRGKQ